MDRNLQHENLLFNCNCRSNWQNSHHYQKLLPYSRHVVLQLPRLSSFAAGPLLQKWGHRSEKSQSSPPNEKVCTYSLGSAHIMHQSWRGWHAGRRGKKGMPGNCCAKIFHALLSNVKFPVVFTIQVKIILVHVVIQTVLRPLLGLILGSKNPVELAPRFPLCSNYCYCDHDWKFDFCYKKSKQICAADTWHHFLSFSSVCHLLQLYMAPIVWGGSGRGKCVSARDGMWRDPLSKEGRGDYHLSLWESRGVAAKM